jgi:DNA-binding CsgD family transcriptional regulator
MAPISDPHKAQRASKAERQSKAFDLLKAGASYRQIAKALDVSHETARKDVEAVLADLRAQATAGAEELRALEDERLTMAALAIAKQVQSGHLGAVDRWVRISESRRKLWGLDAPSTSKNLTLTPDQLRDLTDGELDELERKLSTR